MKNICIPILLAALAVSLPLATGCDDDDSGAGAGGVANNTGSPNNNNTTTPLPDIPDADFQETEPNDGSDDSNVVGELGDGLTIGALIASNDTDAYAINLEAGTIVRVTLEAYDGPADTSLKFELIYSNQDVLKNYTQVLSAKEGETVEFFAAATDIFVLEVEPLDRNALDIDDTFTYVLDIEMAPVETEPIALDDTVTRTSETHDLLNIFAFDATADEQVRWVDGETTSMTELLVFDVAAKDIVRGIMRDEVLPGGEEARRFDAEAGKTYWLVAAMKASASGALRSIAVTLEAIGDDEPHRTLEEDTPLAGVIGAATAGGFVDTDSFDLTIANGASVRVVVEADGDLQPTIGSAMPVDGRAGVELECNKEECTWNLEIGDLRNRGPNPERVGGEGFGYTITMTMITLSHIEVTLPFEDDAASIGDVGEVLRYRGTGPQSDALLICEASDPSGTLDLVCDSKLGFAQRATVFFVGDEEFAVYVRDRHHRGLPDNPINVSLRPIVQPSGIPEVEDTNLPDELSLPARITGNAPRNMAVSHMIAIPVVAGQIIIARGGTDTDSGNGMVSFSLVPREGVGAPLGEDGFGGLTIRVEADGFVDLVIRVSCFEDDIDCFGDESYSVVVYEVE